MKRAALLAALLFAFDASAQGSPDEETETKAKADAKPAKPSKQRVQNIDMRDLRLKGTARGVQLLYFLERANEELERATLERRSFIPRLIQAVDESAL